VPHFKGSHRGIFKMPQMITAITMSQRIVRPRNALAAINRKSGLDSNGIVPTPEVILLKGRFIGNEVGIRHLQPSSQHRFNLNVAMLSGFRVSDPQSITPR
jgi:hypothetical protein